MPKYILKTLQYSLEKKKKKKKINFQELIELIKKYYKEKV